MVAVLRQKSRPYLFSNTLAPAVVGASLQAFRLLNSSTELRDRLANNTAYFRRRMTEAGFNIRPGDHPIVVSSVPLEHGSCTAAGNGMLPTNQSRLSCSPALS